MNDDARTIFLASRSNYQNLIEGTNLPGVSYPSDLPTQLTSKRTSHKIAEQGRRQRINIAITELQTLLPKSSPVISAKGGSGAIDDDEDDDEDGKRGKGSGNSKAATVEAGIAYIRCLQRESERQRAESEREVESLKRKLEEMERKLNSGSSDVEEKSEGVEA
jgi:vesicle coat complex subunit